MSPWLIILTGLIYAYIAVEQLFFSKNIPMTIVYSGYAFSNVGLWWLAKLGQGH
jgi:hypothetical protein